MQGGQHETLIRRAYRAFAERDLETLIELAAPEVELATVTGLLAGRTEPYRGHGGLEEYLRDLEAVWTRLELFPREFEAVDPERTLVFGRVRAWRGRGFLDSANAWLWTVSDGRVTQVQVFANPDDARRFLLDGELPSELEPPTLNLAEPAAASGLEADDV